MAFAAIVTQDGRNEEGTDVIAYRKDPGVFARDLISLLQCRDGSIEVRISGAEDAPDYAIEEDICLLIGKPAKIPPIKVKQLRVQFSFGKY